MHSGHTWPHLRNPDPNQSPPPTHSNLKEAIQLRQKKKGMHFTSFHTSKMFRGASSPNRNDCFPPKTAVTLPESAAIGSEYGLRQWEARDVPERHPSGAREFVPLFANRHMGGKLGPGGVCRSRLWRLLWPVCGPMVHGCLNVFALVV